MGSGISAWEHALRYAAGLRADRSDEPATELGRRPPLVAGEIDEGIDYTRQGQTRRAQLRGRRGWLRRSPFSRAVQIDGARRHRRRLLQERRYAHGRPDRRPRAVVLRHGWDRDAARKIRKAARSGGHQRRPDTARSWHPYGSRFRRAWL